LVQQLGLPCRWEHKGRFELCVVDAGRSNLKLNRWFETGELRLERDPELRGEVEARLAALPRA
jgi:hypothetical protein